MGKLLLLVAVLFAVVAVLRVFASQRRKKPANKATESAPDENKNTPLALLACPQCGIHMPGSELLAHQANHP
jgi:hypothetical protein